MNGKKWVKLVAMQQNKRSLLDQIHCSIKKLGVFLFPLDGMLVHRRSFPCNLLGFPYKYATEQCNLIYDLNTMKGTVESYLKKLHGHSK